MSDTPFRTLGEAFGSPNNHSNNESAREPSYQPPPKRATAKHNKLETFISKIGWAVVVLTALSLSGYSLYWVGIKYGIPPILAVLISTAFDGACIIMGDLNLKYARSSDSGLMPRLGMTALALISAFLNAQHAIIAHDPVAARIFFAAPPITAVLVWEMHTRYEKRNALRRTGRVAKALPAFGLWAWWLYPLRTLKTVRRIVALRLNQTETATSADDLNVTAKQVRAWAESRGMIVSDRGRISEPVMAAFQAEKVAANSNGHKQVNQ